MARDLQVMFENGVIEAPLYCLAHGRTGDKGDTCNISVIAYEPEFYGCIEKQLKADVVANVFRHRRPRRVSRHDLPKLRAFNFVIEGALDGGVNDSLNLDSHGKSLSFYLFDLMLEVPAALASGIRRPECGA